MKIQGNVINGYFDQCTSDEWCDVTATANATGGDGNHIILIFDTMAGPHTVDVRDYSCDIYEGQTEAGWSVTEEAPAPVEVGEPTVGTNDDGTPIIYDAMTDSGVLPDGWSEYDEYHIDEDWLASDPRYSQIPVNWFVDGATDLWKLHKADVWDTAVADAKLKYGELLATCEAGNNCRRERKSELIETLRTEWITLIETFQD